MTTSPAVRVEVLFLRLDDDGEVAWRRADGPVPQGTSPHEVALRLCGGPGRATFLHSTSWRYEDEQELVLTYTALPDPDPGAPAVALVDPCIVSSGDAVRPQPELLHLHHVVAHAVRHVAELVGRDPVVAEAARHGDPDLWRRVVEVAATTPTATHDRAHRLAGRRGGDDQDTRVGVASATEVSAAPRA